MKVKDGRDLMSRILGTFVKICTSQSVSCFFGLLDVSIQLILPKYNKDIRLIAMAVPNPKKGQGMSRVRYYTFIIFFTSHHRRIFWLRCQLLTAVLPQKLN